MPKSFITFSQQEINQLHDLTLSGEEAIVRDRCIIGYYHLLNEEEMRRINGEHIVEGGYWRILPYRKKQERLVPVHALTIPILEQYNYDIPVLDAKTFNRHFKTIIQNAGIKGTYYSVQKENIENKRNYTLRPSIISNSAIQNMFCQIEDPIMALIVFQKTKKPYQAMKIRIGHDYPPKYIKEKYFSQPIRGWVKQTG